MVKPQSGLTVTVFCGLPGTGKTHHATALERESGAVRLSRDGIRSALFPQPDYSDAEKRACYDIVLLLARHHLSLGRSVILEGMPFSRRSERDSARALAEQFSAKLRLIECICPPETAIARIVSQTAHLAGDRGPDLYLQVAARFEPVAPEERPVILSTG